MSHPSGPSDNRGAYAIGPDRRKRPWWLWLLLLVGVIVLVLLLLLLLSRCSSGSDSTGGAAKTTAAPSGSASASSPAPSTKASATPEPAPATTRRGLTSGGTRLLAGPSGSRTADLSKYRGRPVRAHGVSVLAVPADEGFWVGTSRANRAWVQIVGGGESRYHVKAGDKVDFAGTVVRQGPRFAARVGVSDAEGARQLTAEKNHIAVKQNGVQLSTD